jgi:Putative Se/S carrier protein-like
MSEPYSILLFHTNSHAIRAEQVLARSGIEGKLMPVPRHLSSDCGVALRLPREKLDDALTRLQESNVDIATAHDI